MYSEVHLQFVNMELLDYVKVGCSTNQTRPVPLKCCVRTLNLPFVEPEKKTHLKAKLEASRLQIPTIGTPWGLETRRRSLPNSLETNRVFGVAFVFFCWKKVTEKDTKLMLQKEIRTCCCTSSYIYMVHMIPSCTSSYMVDMIPLSTGLKIHLQVVHDFWQSALWAIGYGRARSLRTWRSFQKSKLL